MPNPIPFPVRDRREPQRYSDSDIQDHAATVIVDDGDDDAYDDDDYDDPMPTRMDMVIVVVLTLASVAVVAIFAGWLAAQVSL